jgi:hypothetical protein
MRERRVVYSVLVQKPEGKSHLEDPDVDERVTLRWLFRKWDGCMDRIDLVMIGTDG